MTRRKETALAHPVAPSKWASIRQAERVTYGGAVDTPPRANWKAGGYVEQLPSHSVERQVGDVIVREPEHRHRVVLPGIGVDDDLARHGLLSFSNPPAQGSARRLRLQGA